MAYSVEVTDSVMADLAWAIRHQATITFSGFGEAHRATVRLPDGRLWTASNWRAAIEILRRRGY